MPIRRSTKRLKSWASRIEDATWEQAVQTASMPFVFPHLALMPDAHLGKGATVGSVIPTLRAVMPAAVGVDIGCGMIAVRTQLTVEDLDRDLKPLRQRIESAVPLSAGHDNSELTETAAERAEELEALDGAESAERLAPKWRLQIGSLGSGNHFIEVTRDETGRVWLFLHSGSRGVGNKIATHHIRIAQRECERWWISLPNQDLAYLVEGTKEFSSYVQDLRWAQHFALLNREEMMDRVIGAVAEFVGGPIEDRERINCHHNYTSREHHFGKDVWLSRKGAIDASEGRPGLIPGSMGTASYVVSGLGNPVSLNSSPHGAGRELSRAAARKRFTGEDLRGAMEGIEYRVTDAFLDEHPLAYKDIDTVMTDAEDLVEVRHVLRQLVNVKGD